MAGAGVVRPDRPGGVFPEKGGSTREAKRICLGCEVRDACLSTHLPMTSGSGIWGGLSERSVAASSAASSRPSVVVYGRIDDRRFDAE